MNYSVICINYTSFQTVHVTFGSFCVHLGEATRNTDKIKATLCITLMLLQKAKRSSVTYSVDAKTYIDVKIFIKEDAAGARPSGGVNTLTYVRFWSDPESFTERRRAQRRLLTWIYLHACLST